MQYIYGLQQLDQLWEITAWKESHINLRNYSSSRPIWHIIEKQKGTSFISNHQQESPNIFNSDAEAKFHSCIRKYIRSNWRWNFAGKNFTIIKTIHQPTSLWLRLGCCCCCYKKNYMPYYSGQFFYMKAYFERTLEKTFRNLPSQPRFH